MEFEDTTPSSSSEGLQAERDNTQFLQSMGFGSEDLSNLQNEDPPENGEKVALSSMPNDLDLPGAEKKSRHREGVVVQIGNFNHRVDAAGWIAIPAKADRRTVEDSLEVSKAPSADPVENEVDSDVLNLHCPSCDGELVLRQEHIAVEVACVWYDTKIIADRSGLGGDVKVFSLEPASAPVVK